MTMINISDAGIPMPYAEPMPADPGVDPTYSANIVAGTRNPVAALADAASLIDHAVSTGQPAVTVMRDGSHAFVAASGDAVAWSVSLPTLKGAGDDLHAVTAHLADATRAFDQLDAARDAALAAAEAAYDGKQLDREQAAIEKTWLDQTYAASARVSQLARRLEAAAVPAPALSPEGVVMQERLSWGAKHLPPDEFMAELEARLNAGEHADLIGGFLRKQATTLPPWWKKHTGQLTSLLSHPALADGGAYGRAQTATRIARQARAAMFTRLAKVAGNR